MSPTMTFNHPSSATVERPVVTSNSPVTEIVSPKPIRRVSMDSIIRLAGIIEVSVAIPPPTDLIFLSSPSTPATIITTVTTSSSNPACSNTATKLKPASISKLINTMGISNLLFGSVPDFGSGGRFGIIGGEFRGKRIGVIGGERMEWAEKGRKGVTRR